MSGPRAIMRALGVPGLTHAEARLFAYYVGRANGARMCWPLIEETSADLDDMPQRTIMRGNRGLEAKGRLRIERRYKDSSHYFILDPDGRVFGGQSGTADEASAACSDLPKTAPEQVSVRVSEMAPQAPSDLPILRCQKRSADLPKTVVPKEKTQERLKEGRESPLTPHWGAKRRRHPLPDDWRPEPSAHAIASDLGLEPDRVDAEAEQFRDAAAAAGWTCADWHARFRNWLREEAKRDGTRRGRSRGGSGLSQHEQIRRDGGFGSFLIPDEKGRLLQ